MFNLLKPSCFLSRFFIGNFKTSRKKVKNSVISTFFLLFSSAIAFFPFIFFPSTRERWFSNKFNFLNYTIEIYSVMKEKKSTASNHKINTILISFDIIEDVYANWKLSSVATKHRARRWRNKWWRIYIFRLIEKNTQSISLCCPFLSLLFFEAWLMSFSLGKKQQQLFLLMKFIIVPVNWKIVFKVFYISLRPMGNVYPILFFSCYLYKKGQAGTQKLSNKTKSLNVLHEKAFPLRNYLRTTHKPRSLQNTF